MLKLRPYKTCDADKIASWIGSERTLYEWGAGKYSEYPVTGEDIDGYYRSFSNSDRFFAMTAFDGDGVCGHFVVRYPTEDRSTVRLGFIIVDGTKRGKGYGRELVLSALNYAFVFLGAKSVTLGVFESNLAARKCYDSLGFSEFDPPESTYYEIAGEQRRCIELVLTDNKFFGERNGQNEKY